MPYDLFISYAHQGDNASREAVTALVARLHAELESDFRRRFNRDLEIFFDKEDIKDFDHWRVRCHRALRDSRFFIACLSRTYLRSDACRWEWEEWCRHELEHGLVGQGAASLWFVKLEDLDAPEDAALLSRWKGDLLQRFHIQCHEWRHDNHGNFLDVAARSELQQLTEHVAQRLRLLTLDRARRGNLPWPNANFVGREPELASLRAALLDAPEQSPAGLHGVGGMGKTALAQAFAYKEADAFPGGCWLLRCEGRDLLPTVFRTLVTELEIELTDEEKLDDAKAVRRVFGVLRARGPALFLLDNVDHPALLAQEQMKLLADQPWARVLYTTRLAPDEFTKVGAIIRPLDLDRLPENQAVDLIRRYQPEQAFASPEHEAAAREIVRELSGLTLAVETAAIYLGECDPRNTESQYAVDVRNYLNKLREDLMTGGSEGVMNQLREVTATLRPTLARLDAPARTVLQVASLLPPDGVALPWVRAIAGQSHPELATEAATGESDPWTQLIRGLIGMRLFQPSTEPRVASIHRILRRVLKSDLLRGNDALQHKLVCHVQAQSRTLAEHWTDPTCRWEITPMESLLQDFPRAELRAAGEIAYNLGLVQLELGNIGSAERSVLAAQQIDNVILPVEHPSRGATLDTLGRILWARGKTEEAESCMRRAIDLARNADDQAQEGLSFRLNNLAQMLKQSGKLTEAEPLFREALALQEQTEGKDGRHVAECLHNLSGLSFAAGRYDEAEAFLNRAVAIEERVLPPNHPNRAIRLMALAKLAKTKGQDTQAGSFASQALKIAENSFGNESGNLLPFLFACIDTASDSVAERRLRLRALALSPFGAQHRFEDTLGEWLGNLHALLESNAEATASKSTIRTALDATRFPNQESASVFLHCRACIAFNLVDWGKPIHAIAVLDETRREAGSLGYALTMDYADGLTTVANRLRKLDKDSEAADIFYQVLAIHERNLGASDPRLSSVLNNLGTSLGDANRLEEAAAAMERAVPLAVAFVGDNSIDYVTLTHNYMTVLARLGRFEKAEAMAVETIIATELNRVTTGQAHPYQEHALEVLRLIQIRLGRDPQAAMFRLQIALAARQSQQ